MKKLYSTLYGSYLYGTNTPTSDLDRKVVFLPELNDLLLCKKVANKVKVSGEKDGVDKSQVVDEELVPLQVFARDFLEGQTYALELAFSVPMNRRDWFSQLPTKAQARVEPYPFFESDGSLRDLENPNHAQQTLYEHGDVTPELFPEMVAELRSRFLTKNMKALMGYAVHQASLYSVKGERLNALNAVTEVVLRENRLLLENDQKHAGVTHDPRRVLEGTRLGELEPTLRAVADRFPKYAKVTEYNVGNKMAPCLVLLEKTFPFTDTLYHVSIRLKALLDTYGERANAARADEVDWKATMHALRVLEEGVALLKHGELSFPYKRADVKRYLDVKQGKVPYPKVVGLLEQRLEELKHLEEKSPLPVLNEALRVSFDAWLAGWVRRFYGLA